MPDGLTYEVQTYNERNPDHVQQPNSEWRRTFLVDATHPVSASRLFRLMMRTRRYQRADDPGTR